MPSRLLIVDDHALFAHGVALLVQQRLGLACQVVASVEAALQVVQAAAPEPPVDAVLLDLQLPGLSGLEGVVRLLQARPSLAIVVCSSHVGEAARGAALARGARAFVGKAEPPEVLLAALRRVLQGAHTDTAAGAAAVPGGTAAGATTTLTTRQREVLWLVAEGKSNKVIGRQLDMSENTVRNHVAAILERLGVDNRVEAIAAARQLGLLDHPT